MTDRYRATQHHAGYVWHVEDRARCTIDVVAFRPEGIVAAPAFVIAVVDAAIPAARLVDALAYVERRLAPYVGLRLP